MLSHRNLVANMVQCEGLFALSPDDVVLAALPFFHLAGLAGIMNTGLRAGATIVTMPRFESGQFLDLLERYAVTRGHAVPPMVLALVRDPAVARRNLTALRHIMCGAAPLAAELEQELAQRMGCAVNHIYGLTETSPITHMVPITDSCAVHESVIAYDHERVHGCRHRPGPRRRPGNARGPSGAC
jgi:acyl-CoA synthetase (AMP-forming)/AMP-acid ligase II